jgi:hypothetical protein
VECGLDCYRTTLCRLGYKEGKKKANKIWSLLTVLFSCFYLLKFILQVRYVQGMNEIVGTIYYVLANDHNPDWAIHAEVDTYFLFHTLMIDMRDVFVPDLDTSDTGIQGRIENMQRLLQTHDPEVFEHLQECGIDASFFAIRWLTTLLSREFLLPDTIRLWDSMFASTHKENFLRYVCGTMVMMVREDLLKGDFSSCLRLLQSYPPANVDDILESSRALWIYESQINIACHKGGISLHQALQTVSPPPAIFMAFGLKGGVAPRKQEHLRATAAHNAQEGLLGRAKRLWNGWGGATETDSTMEAPETMMTTTKKEETTNTTTQTTAAAATAATTDAPRRRIWNRGRTDSVESANNNSGENLAALSGDEEVEKVVAKETTETPPPRRRIWNRGRSNTNESTENNNTTATTTPPPTLTPAATEEPKPAAAAGAAPPRTRFWNQGGTTESTTLTSTSKEDTTLASPLPVS